MKRKLKFLIVVGARPNFIKIAPLFEEFKNYKNIKPALVHTGQHYDYKMSQVFFHDLNIPKPDYNLGVGSGSHAWQTAKTMERLEPVLLKEKPDLVIVVGDVNSTLAGALVAAKLHIPVAHIEAGLRSFDMAMPEEINRRLTDHISDFLFVTEPSGVKHLLNEGIDKKKIYLVGNIMIDALIKSKEKIRKSKILKELNLKKKKYAVLTLHRPENVDNKKKLKALFSALEEVQEKIKLIYPIHPRVRKRIAEFGLIPIFNKMKNLILIDALGYLDFLSLEAEARFVLTDSGGIQEETTFLRLPCLTLRRNTERPTTVEIGTNIICGNDRKKIIREVDRILLTKQKRGKIPKFWDGKVAQRITKIIYNHLSP